MDGTQKNHGRTIRHNSPRVGFLLLDASFEPIYANDDAIQILTYPKGQRERRELRSLDGVLGKKIRSLLFDNHSSSPSLPPTAFLSGRRHYHCRAFAVESNSTNPSDATVVLFQRGLRESIDVAQMAPAFHLTEREQETVGFLIEGLTSKEIATHMNISPNSVKAFIRLVMIKMGVSTRSGIIGKIVKNHTLR